MNQGTDAQLKQLSRTGKNICHLWLSLQVLFKTPQILLKTSSCCQTPQRGLSSLWGLCTLENKSGHITGQVLINTCLGGHCQCLYPLGKQGVKNPQKAAEQSIHSGQCWELHSLTSSFSCHPSAWPADKGLSTEQKFVPSKSLNSWEKPNSLRARACVFLPPSCGWGKNTAYTNKTVQEAFGD